MALYWRRLSSTAIIWARTITMHHVVRHSLHRIMVLGQISAEKVVKWYQIQQFFATEVTFTYNVYASF